MFYTAFVALFTLSNSTPSRLNHYPFRNAKNAADPKAIDELKADQTLPENAELRRVKYLNNIVEQDHRFIKRLVNPVMGFGSFNTARRTLRGYEAMNMIRKGQFSWCRKRRHYVSGRIRVSNFRSCCLRRAN